MKLFSNINFKYVFLIIISTIIIGYILGMTISTVVDYRLKDAVINLPKPINRIFLKLKNKKFINLNRKQKGRKLEIEIEKKNEIIDKTFKKKGKLKNKNNSLDSKEADETVRSIKKDEINNNSKNTYNVESFDPNSFKDNSPFKNDKTPWQYEIENKVSPYFKTKGVLFGYNKKSTLGSFSDNLTIPYSPDFTGVDETTKIYSKLYKKSLAKKGKERIAASNIEDLEQQFQPVEKEAISPAMVQGSDKIQRKKIVKKKRKRKAECKVHTK